MFESLHNHTKHSDGELTHVELLREAEKEGYSIIAFTDHDVLPTSKHIEEVENFETTVKYIWGVEITAGSPEPTCAFRSFHTTALFVDPTNKDLLEFCEVAKKRRIDRVHFMVENLNKFGFIVTEEDVFSCGDGESIGRPHIVKALQKHSENTAILERMLAEYIAACEKDPSLKTVCPDAFDASKGLWSKCYTLFLSANAYIKGIYKESEYPPLQACIRTVHQAGGILVLAHYCTIANKVSVDEVEGWLKKGYLDGCETVYDYTRKSVSGDEADEDPRPKRESEMAELKKKCVSNNKIWFIGGGDIHYFSQIKKFAQSFGRKTVGMTEHLLNSFPKDRFDLQKTSNLLKK